ncbi:MAG: CPBP family intramembrane metalloprotease [Planctomycetales bacterium]|nr:CPBP family intramembrane metalloprotease [Planctomycetales bacterium]
METWVPTAIWGFLACLVAGSVYGWLRVLLRVQHGVDVLDWNERRPVPWGLVYVAVCFVLLVICETGALQMLDLGEDAFKLEDLTREKQTAALLGMAGGRLMATLLGLFTIHVLTHARSHDTGATLARAGYDIWLGAKAFVLFAAPIYLLQYLLSTIWPEAAHPLVDLVREAPDGGLYGAVFLTAVVAAPVAEEFLLRGVFQGWLEKLAVWNGPTSDLLVSGTIDWAPRDKGWSEAKQARPLDSRPPWWPVIVSSGLFAIMHIQNKPSPDPIALFFFALGLGFLYQRTHRLLPCVVMHLLLNLSSMLILGLSIWRPELLPISVP